MRWPPERRLPGWERLNLLVLWDSCGSSSRGGRRRHAVGQVDRGLHKPHVLVCQASNLGRTLSVLLDFRNARSCKDALVANGAKTIKGASSQFSLSVIQKQNASITVNSISTLARAYSCRLCFS